MISFTPLRLPVNTACFVANGHAFARSMDGHWLEVDDSGHMHRVPREEFTRVFETLSKGARICTHQEFLRHVAPDAQLPI